MNYFLEPDEKKIFEYGNFSYSLKPVSKGKMIAFLGNHLAFSQGLFNGKIMQGFEDKQFFTDVITLISECITEWSFEKPINAKNVEKLAPHFLYLLYADFLNMNFVGKEDVDFLSKTPKRLNSSEE